METFRWVFGEGMSSLGYLPGGKFVSFAAGVAHEGSIIVGTSESLSGAEVFLGVPRGF